MKGLLLGLLIALSLKCQEYKYDPERHVDARGYGVIKFTYKEKRWCDLNDNTVLLLPDGGTLRIDGIWGQVGDSIKIKKMYGRWGRVQN